MPTSLGPRGSAFDALPDDLVLAVLKALPLPDRCRSAARVCTRFHALATHPSLLRELDLSVGSGWHDSDAVDARLAAKLESLCTFLVRHAAAHLRRLELRVELTQHAMPGDATCAALRTLAFRLAAHCSAYGGLEELSITGINVVEPLEAGWWAPLAPTLRRLRYEIGDDMDYFEELFVEPNMAALTRLQDLWITGREQQLDENTVFPPALTRLHLGFFDMFGLPTSLSSLKKLQYLSLAYCPLEEDDLEPLAACPALTQLTLECCHHLPASLAQLTQLRALAVDNTPENDEQQPEARLALLGALQQLQALTRLAFKAMDWLAGVPAEVGSLPQLARFCWHTDGWQDLPDPLLPGGAWLSSLRQLAVPLNMGAVSLQQLTAAQQLECLAVQLDSGHHKRTDNERRQRQLHQAAVLAWAAQHPTLSRLALGDDELETLADWRAALALARWPGRPPLAIVPSEPIFDELGCVHSIGGPW